MSELQTWIERVFEFDLAVEQHTELVQRLARTPDRLEELTDSLRAEQLVFRPDGGWSIQENVGHLLDLETLFMGRLDDYEAGVDELRPADMSNRATDAAGHNDRDIHELLSEFGQVRARLVKRLAKLPAEAFSRSAFHRRLNVKMRLVDMCYFQAEHDEHHMAKIERLREQVA
jgi:uncharacterized damage-inducible protein DinB